MLKKIFFLIFKVSLILVITIIIYHSGIFYGGKKVQVNSQKTSIEQLTVTKKNISGDIEKAIEKQNPHPTTLIKDTNLIQNRSGSSITSINLMEHASQNDRPLLGIPNAKQGDSFKVDGPLWYDGNAKLAKYDSKSLQMDISMKAADKVLGYDVKLPFKLKDGKLNLSINLEKKSEGNYSLVIVDKNNNGSKQVQNVKETEKMIGGKKELTFAGALGTTTFTISSAGDIAIKPHGVPFTLDLNKN